MDYAIDLNENQIDAIEKYLNSALIKIGVKNVLMIDLAGNTLMTLDNGHSDYDLYSLAALAAGNFGTVSEIAKLIGEDDFSALFHKGENTSIHFSRINKDILLITIFGTEISLGFVRLKVADAVAKIQSLINPATGE